MTTDGMPEAAVTVAKGARDLRVPGWPIFGGAALIVAWLALVPLAFLLWQSFMTPLSPGSPSRFTFANYATAFAGAETFRLLGTSLGYAGGASLLSLAIGTALAWINERTNTPLKRLFYALSIVPLIIPGILFVTAWILLASPRIGVLNLLLQQAFATDAVFFDVYTLSGMMWVDGIQHAPLAFLFMSAAFRAIDPALEESAMLSGAGLLQTARRVTLKLALPAAAAAFLLLFVRSLESFENPALLGLPAGIEVFTSSIYEAVRAYPSDTGLASAYAVLLVIIAAAGIHGQARLFGRGAGYATLGGKGFRARVIDLGLWRYGAASLFLLYALLVIGLPFLVLVWSSLQRFYSAPSLSALQTVSLENYRAVLDYPGIGAAIANSLMLAAAAASVAMALTAVIAWIVLRSRIPGRGLLDQIASLPLVVPGLVVGLALMVVYLALPIGVYGTLWILLFAYLTRFLPYGMRFNAASLTQIHPELEEASGLSGASWAATFHNIVLPLMKPSLMAGWLVIVILSLRELSSSILLYSPGTEVISVVLWELWQDGQYVQLSALGVMMILVLFVFVMAAQALGGRLRLSEA